MAVDEHVNGSAPTDADALRAEIAATRAQLGQTVEALAVKTDVKARTKDALNQTVADAKDRGHQAINRGRYFAARPGPRAVNAGKLVVQCEPAPFQHFGCAIQNLAPRIRAVVRPARDCASCRPDRIAKIFSRCTSVISQHVSMPITRGNDASIFAAGEFSADEKLVGFLYWQPGRLFGHKRQDCAGAEKRKC